MGYLNKTCYNEHVTVKAWTWFPSYEVLHTSNAAICFDRK